MSSPKVSIIIPTYNRSELLMETLQSVKNQTFTNWECIIVDDSSTDGTSEKVQEVCTDERFQYFLRPKRYPKGACFCRNYGFEKSKGKFIQWLDDDDLLSENKLEVQVKIMEELDDDYIFTLCSWDLLWEGKTLDLKNAFIDQIVYKPIEFYKKLKKSQTFIPPHAFLVSRTLALKAGAWNTHLKINQDAEYFSRIVVSSESFLSTPQCYVLYREHSGNRVSVQQNRESINSLILSWRLIHANLLRYELKDKKYFKWKLLLIFHKFYKKHPDLLERHYYFFLENGVKLNWSKYYFVKYHLYKLIYPRYKKVIKNKKN